MREVGPGPDSRWLVAAAGAVLRHPSLWGTALVQVRRLAPRGWWRRSPHLPVPDPSYLRFRLATMYGDAALVPDPHDVVTYLRWCREFPRSAARNHRPAGK
jgi:hypothetical protein